MSISLIVLVALALALVNLSYHPATTELGCKLRGSSKNSMYILSKKDSLRGLTVAILMLTHEHLAPTRKSIERVLSTVVLCITVLTFSFTTPVVDANVQATTTQATAPAVALGTPLFTNTNTEEEVVPTLTTESGYDSSAIMSYAHELAADLSNEVDYSLRLKVGLKAAWRQAKAQA